MEAQFAGDPTSPIAASRSDGRAGHRPPRAAWLTPWLAPAGLVLLSVVPSVAGAVRLAELGGGATVTPDNARFFAAPLPVVLHIVSVTLFALLGAFQFAPRLRRGRRAWHRVAGRLVLPSGLVAALSGLWMSQFYALPAHDGAILYGLRLLFGWGMVLCLILGAVAIRRRAFADHGAWMTRAYAIGLGAGTQVLTALPWIVLLGAPGELARAAQMGAGWVINLLIAEWVIRRRAGAIGGGRWTVDK